MHELLSAYNEYPHITKEFTGTKHFVLTRVHYIQTRFCLYKEMEVMSSMCLPPDPNSIVKVIKRLHYQVYL